MILGLAEAVDAGIGVGNLERPAVERDHPQIAILGGGQIFLDDRIAVTDNRLYDLVEVLPIALVDQENALAARALQWLDHALAIMRVEKAANLSWLAGDAGCRTNGFWKSLEIGLVHRIGQLVGIVEYDRAAQRGELAKQQAGRRRPVARGQFHRRIAAQHQYVVVGKLDPSPLHP